MLTKPIAPFLAAAAAAVMTFVPAERGGIRILQAIWFLFGADNDLLAALLHGAVIGAFSFAAFLVARRLGHPAAGNLIVAIAFAIYAFAFFNVGVPMVASN